jgi:diguanylate cyclase (GGDEF)-like protein
MVPYAEDAHSGRRRTNGLVPVPAERDPAPAADPGGVNPALPSSALLEVIATQNEIVARGLMLEEATAVVCARAVALTSAARAWVELFEGDPTAGRSSSAPVFALPPGAVASAPILHRGRELGVLSVLSPHPDASGEGGAKILGLLGSVLAAHVLRERDNEVQSRVVRHDPVTGLGDRRHYEERIAAEVAAAARAGRQLSLLLLELDPAGCGHEALCAVARVLRGLRESDGAFRIGERRFAVLLPGASLLGGRVVAERLSDRIASDGTAPGRVSAAWGVAAMDDPDPRRLHAAAESLLAVPAAA